MAANRAVADLSTVDAGFDVNSDVTRTFQRLCLNFMFFGLLATVQFKHSIQYAKYFYPATFIYICRLKF